VHLASQLLVFLASLVWPSQLVGLLMQMVSLLLALPGMPRLRRWGIMMRMLKLALSELPRLSRWGMMMMMLMLDWRSVIS
jgi:hypothetical protein